MMHYPKLYTALLLFTLVFASCNRAAINELNAPPALIPQPNQIEWKSLKAYTFGNNNTISIPKEIPHRDLLMAQLNATLEQHHLSTLAPTIDDEGHRYSSYWITNWITTHTDWKVVSHMVSTSPLVAPKPQGMRYKPSGNW